jgi:poly-gamma-glutamate synthesis protein (capsule biosynthesis protein)
MRWLLYGVAGTAAFVVLYAALLMAHHPRDLDAERADPVVITRNASVDGDATLLFAGDTAQIDDALPILQQKGFQYPFVDTLDLIRDADVAVANLEAPITAGGRKRLSVPGDYIYRAPPESANALAWAGFDVLGLANNHALDYGAEGLADTIALLQKAGVVTVGAGATPAEARRGVVARIGSLRVGLLAFCEEQLLYRTFLDLFVRRHHPGVAALVEDDLRRDVARLRAQSDLVVVMLHAGDNYAPPLASTQRWGERAIDAGADLVVVHHPHVAHPVAVYHGKPILLSLGNYAFGTPGKEWLHLGWLANAVIHAKKLQRVELIPIDVQNRRVFFRPEPLAGNELDAALTKMAADSRPYGASLRISHEGRGRVILDVAP